MKHLSPRQETIRDDYHFGIHLLKKLPTLTEVARNRELRVPTVKQHMDAIRDKGYLGDFDYCPYCGRQLER